MTSSLFDTDFIQLRKARASKHYTNDNGHFLINWTLKEISERLDLLTRRFEQAIVHGEFFDESLLNKKKIKNHLTSGLNNNHNIVNMSEYLPYKKQSCDLIVSLFEMHRLNDPLGYLIQNLYALKPDGFFVGAFPGEGSLVELTDCLSKTEAQDKHGASLRTLPLMSKQDAGHLMQRAGFNLPVVDSETIRLSYRSISKLYEDIRMSGGGNVLMARNKTFCGRNFFKHVETCYKDNYMNEDDYLEATMEILFVSGWAPHDNQQKPLPRGTGQTSLTEIL